MGDEGTLEAALAAVEGQADAVLRLATGLVSQLRRVKADAVSGQLRDLGRDLDGAQAAAARVSEAATELRAGFSFDDQAHLSSGAYTKELLAAAHDAGVEAFEEDDRILSYPSVIRLLPGERALEIDRRRERRLRPSVVARLLAVAQGRSPRFKPEPFLESLLAAYQLVLARDGKQPDAVVRLVDVYVVLTLLPGQARDYSRQEFARDLYLLDQTGVTSTPRSDLALRWAASTGTRGAGVLTTVARGGQQQRYWGIAFSSSSSSSGGSP